MAPATEAFLPIAELSAYQTKWTIKARVTDKAPLRTFAKGAGQGKVFSVGLLDSFGGEIKATFFNDAADKFHDVMEKGNCFTLTRGSIRVANKAYNSYSHRYELTFDKDAVVEATGEDSSIEAFKLNITNLRALQAKTLPCTVDLCGIVTSFEPAVTVTSKEGQELTKRDITITDDNAMSVKVALWAERAKLPDKDFEGHPVVSMKSVAMREWRETRSGSLLQGGALLFNQESPETKRLQQWWTQGGSSQQLLNLSQGAAGSPADGGRKTIATTLSGVRAAADGLGSEPQLFNVVVKLAGVQTRKQGEPQPLHYMACQEKVEGRNLPCNRRVDQSGFCAACNRAGKVAPRVNIRCRFSDYEDQAWLTSFHEAATKILGMSADEVRALEAAANEKGEVGREELEAAVRKTYFDKPLNVTVRAKMEMYNGEARSNISVVDAKPILYGEHGRQMLKNIQEILAC